MFSNAYSTLVFLALVWGGEPRPVYHPSRALKLAGF